MGYSEAQGNSCQTPFKLFVVHLTSVDLRTKKHVVFHRCSGRDRKIYCFQDLYSVNIVLWCQPWKLKVFFAIFTSKTTKKGLHSQYLYILRVPDGRMVGCSCWPWMGGVGVGQGRVVAGGGGGGCDTTFGPDRKTRWFSNGWLLRIRCYSVLQSHFFQVFKEKCQGFFPPQKVMLWTDLLCTCTILYIWPRQRTVILTVWDGIYYGTPSMNSISVRMSRKIFSRLQKKLFN